MGIGASVLLTGCAGGESPTPEVLATVCVELPTPTGTPSPTALPIWPPSPTPTWTPTTGPTLPPTFNSLTVEAPTPDLYRAYLSDHPSEEGWFVGYGDPESETEVRIEGKATFDQGQPGGELVIIQNGNTSVRFALSYGRAIEASSGWRLDSASSDDPIFASGPCTSKQCSISATDTPRNVLMYGEPPSSYTQEFHRADTFIDYLIWRSPTGELHPLGQVVWGWSIDVRQEYQPRGEESWRETQKSFHSQEAIPGEILPLRMDGETLNQWILSYLHGLQTD